MGRVAQRSVVVSKFGTKYTCWSCGAKFYDLNKPDPTCPKCGEDPKVAPQTSGPLYDDNEEGDFDLDVPGLDEEE